MLPAPTTEPVVSAPPSDAQPQPVPAPPAAATPPPTTPPAGAPVAPPPGAYVYVPPPPGPKSMSKAERVHAPDYSLWVGGSLGLLAYSGSMYSLPPDASQAESTGNFVKPGLSLEGDVGARLGRRYIPYVAVELGFMGAGHRFTGTSTNASTSFIGVGVRYQAGDVNSVSFVSDISIGWRTFRLSNAGGTWTASAFELFRLGFGVDVRLSTRMTLTPMATITGGMLSDTGGTVSFAPQQPDGLTQPSFTGSGGVPPAFQTSYLAFVFGCGIHFDLLGK
jgi:hypothetical protein